MNFSDYAEKANKTLLSTYEYGNVDAQLMGIILGLGGESGEVLEKFKKIMRDKNGQISDDEKNAIIKELGDVLWYVNATAELIGSSLEEVATKNNEKLLARKEKNTLSGNGDDR